jgi:hypothetical protein
LGVNGRYRRRNPDEMDGRTVMLLLAVALIGLAAAAAYLIYLGRWVGHG